VYEAPTSGKCGYFSQLGTKEPYLLTITNKTVDGVKTIEDEITKTPYGELSTGVPSTTPAGFFYLIKLDQGFLVADRMVQWGVTWAAMNTKNYIYGAVFNCEDARTIEYVDIEVTTKDWEEGDFTTSGYIGSTGTIQAAEYNPIIDEQFNDIKKRYRKWEKTQVEVTTKQIEVEEEQEVQKTEYNEETGQDEPVVDGEGNPVMETVMVTVTKTVNDKLITTKTTTTKYWAKVPDVVAKIANTIPVQLEVPYGSDSSVISDFLAGVTEVTCTIQNSDDTAYQKQVAVTEWDVSTYDKGSTGAQIVLGTLEDLEVSLDPIRNPSEIKAACTVIVKPDQLVEITSTFNDITVTSDITAEALAEQLATTYPTCDISYKKYGQDDSQAVPKTGIAITWNVAEQYTAGTVGEQTIIGELEDLTPYGIENTGFATPSVKIITNPV
jgi:hypothetical protein